MHTHFFVNTISFLSTPSDLRQQCQTYVFVNFLVNFFFSFSLCCFCNKGPSDLHPLVSYLFNKFVFTIFKFKKSLKMQIFRNLGFQNSVKSQLKFIYCIFLQIRVTKHYDNILQNLR